MRDSSASIQDQSVNGDGALPLQRPYLDSASKELLLRDSVFPAILFNKIAIWRLYWSIVYWSGAVQEDFFQGTIRCCLHGAKNSPSPLFLHILIISFIS